MSVVKTFRVQPAAAALLASAIVVGALSGCHKNAADSAANTAAATNTQAAAQASAPPAQAVSAQVAAMTPDALRAAASSAQREQRLYAPAGNNAMEYYLALRDKVPGDAAAASAMTDLLPYAKIATEQSISRDDFVEAQRLYALMDKADPKYPGLERLKQSIADGQASLAQRTAAAATKTVDDAKKQADLEKQRLADQQKTQQAAAQQLATQQAAAAAAAQQAAEQKAADERAAAAKAAAAATRPAQPPATAAAAPSTARAEAPAASNTLHAISTPAPAYPPEAFRSGTSGEVVVELTVGNDGSVSSARVVRATPPRVFDRAALAAVKGWRFDPVSAPVTTRRTIGFNPGG